ncbi:UDP-sugar pyrophosphorylase 1 [Glycine max]|nr:UDP-sugar pyrophosphorylase 1 [Glycine max]
MLFRTHIVFPSPFSLHAVAVTSASSSLKGEGRKARKESGSPEGSSYLLQRRDSISMASSLDDNFNLLSPEQQELVKVLLDNGQEHLFRDWPAPGVDDNHKKAFFDQLTQLDSSYPGGLESYIKNAKRLLADSKAGINPFDGFTPSVPTGETLAFGDESYIKFEEAGVLEARLLLFLLPVVLASV